ncbi:hypothetical protein GCM10028784_07280 [Myceligenerans cantabricum]
MSGYPNDPEAKKAIRSLKKDFDWQYDDEVGDSSHLCGWLKCGDVTDQVEKPCKVPVYRTANNTARAVWKAARKCPHGKDPDRRQW